MAILIPGKTTCSICGDVIETRAECVGFPNGELSASIAHLSDSCLHRACLIQHHLRDELTEFWSRQWRGGVSPVDGAKHISEAGTCIIRKRRFVFVEFEHFIEIEEERGCITKLREYLTSADPSKKSVLALEWNAYQIHPSNGGVQLEVRSKPSGVEGAAAIALSSGVVSQWFTLNEWKGFVRLAEQLLNE